jgi:hypothetical protein
MHGSSSRPHDGLRHLNGPTNTYSSLTPERPRTSVFIGLREQTCGGPGGSAFGTARPYVRRAVGALRPQASFGCRCTATSGVAVQEICAPFAPTHRAVTYATEGMSARPETAMRYSATSGKSHNARRFPHLFAYPFHPDCCLRRRRACRSLGLAADPTPVKDGELQ